MLTLKIFVVLTIAIATVGAFPAPLAEAHRRATQRRLTVKR